MVNDMRREKIKRVIEVVMIMLLKDQSFDEILMINLIKIVGISCFSFYIYYKDKYEMID